MTASPAPASNSIRMFLTSLALAASVLGLQPDPWKEFTTALRRFRCYQVTALSRTFDERPFQSSPRPPKWSRLTVKGEQRVLETSEETTYWDGSAATSYSVRTGKISKSPRNPGLGVFDYCGFGTASMAGEVLTSPSGVGLRYSTTHVDTSATFEMWFDPETKLPARAIYGTDGMQPRRRYEINLKWQVNPVIGEVFFEPKKPKDEALAPPHSKNLSFEQIKGLPAGFGQITVRLPAKVEGEVTVFVSGDLPLRFHGTGFFTVPLPASSYRISIGDRSIVAGVHEGYESKICPGAIKNTTKKAVALLDEHGLELFELEGNAISGPLLPGNYFVRVAKERKKLVVTSGIVSPYRH